MRQLIMTRHLIGVSRPSAYALRTRLLLETTLPALAAQTSENFTWVVIADALIPADAKAMILDAFSGHQNFRLLMFDPFAAGRMFPEVAALVEETLGTREDIITTRLDDDDAVGTTFVESMQRAAGRHAEPAALSFPKGVALVPDLGLFGFEINRNIAIGISVYSPAVDRANVLMAPHNKLHERIARVGGTSVQVEADTPHWLHVRTASSDSGERYRRVLAPTDPMKASRWNAAWRRTAAMFALPADMPSKLSAIHKRYPPERPHLVSPQDSKGRIATKGQILKVARDLTSLEAKVALREAFYAL